jgi:cobalt-zinc-cadmium efflux system outer membrane protein
LLAQAWFKAHFKVPWELICITGDCFSNSTEFTLLHAVMLSAIALAPANVLSAADVVSLVQTQDPAIRAAREAVTMAKADEIEAGMYGNPSVAWEREELAGEGEDALLVSVPIALSSARTMREQLAGADVAQANAQEALVKSQAVVKALTAFYRLQALQKQSIIEADALERLIEAVRVVSRRREEGNASGYDQSRIEIEAELAASTWRRTRTRVERLHDGLARSLGKTKDTVSFVGSLEFEGAILPDEKSVVKAGARASLRSLWTAAERATRASQSSSTAWLPELVLSGGPRRSSVHAGELGYQLGVSLELPFFTRGQGISARASARERYIQAHVEAAERAASIERVNSSERLKAARKEALRFAETTVNQSEVLERAAQSGYREGALSIVELLDAQKTRTELEIRQLALALAVKQAEVAFCASRGDYE